MTSNAVDAPTGGRAVVPVIAISAAAIAVGSGFVNLTGYLIPVIRDDLGLSRTALGMVVSLFFGSTGIGSIAGGRFADRFGARWAVSIQFALVLVASAAVAVTGAYVALALGGTLVGFGYAVANAGTNIAVASTMPIGHRGIGLTLKTAGGPTFASAGAFVAGTFGSRLGWQPIFGGLAMLSAVGGIVALLVLPDDRPATRPTIQKGVLPRGFIWFPIASFFFIAGAQPLFQWIVPYLEEDLDAGGRVAGSITSVAVAVGVVTMIFAALRSDRMGEGNRLGVLTTACATCIVGIALLVLAPRVHLSLAIVGAIVGMSGLLVASGVLPAAVVDAAPHAVGRASGVAFSGYYLGALVSPVTFGAIADWTGSYDDAWITACASLVIAALAFMRCAAVSGPR